MSDGGRKHIPALDGVRGFAAAMVFVFHYGGGKQSPELVIHYIGKAIHFGWAGVSLFFVLSGFLISGILWDSFGRRQWWPRFYSRRALRIFPLYYLALLLAILVGFMSIRSLGSLGNVWPYLIYLQDAPRVHGTLLRFPTPLRLLHFWSLAVEEQFYLIWPFALWCLRGRNSAARRMCLAVWCASLAYRVLIYSCGLDHGWATEFLFGRAGELALGAYLALAVRDERVRALIRRTAPWAFWASLFVVAATVAWSGTTELNTTAMGTAGLAANGVLFASLMALCLRPGWLSSAFSLRGLRWLGKISYGVYVYHMLLYSVFEKIVTVVFPRSRGNVRYAILFFVAAAGTLAVSSLSFYLFEARFLRLKEKLAADLPEVESVAIGR